MSRLDWSKLTGWITALLLSTLANTKFSPAAQAQIRADTSLPVNSVVPDGCTLCPITGGTLTSDRQTLFHSFQQFSVPTGGAALFQNDPALATIITRITGSLPSDIDGAITAQGNVDFFLLNPNGIIFGPNAVLQVPGSFIASSADSAVFENGNVFSATQANAPPLLTVSAPVGLQLGATPGEIRVEGPGTFPPTLPGLFVSPGQTLALVGGDVTVAGGTVSAPSGRLEVGSAAEGTVSLKSVPTGFELEYASIPRLGAINLTQGALLNTSGPGAGDIDLQGQTVLVEDGSQVLALTLGPLPGGNLRVTADSVTVQGDSANGQIISRLSTDTIGDGRGGSLIVNTGQLQVRDRGLLSASTGGNGPGGDLILRASDSIELTGLGFDTLQGLLLNAIQGTLDISAVESGLLAGSGGSGPAGQLWIDTARLRLQDGAIISTTTSSTGAGGEALVTATESVEITGSAFLTGTLQGTTEDAGDLSLNTRRLLVRDGGLLQTFTFGAGNGGDLVVNAIESVDLLDTPAGAIAPTGIFANSIFGTGPGGKIEINTQELTTAGGAQIGNQTGALLGTGLIPLGGPAGDVILNVGGTTRVIGLSPDGRFVSGPGTASLSGAPAGNVVLSTGNLVIRDGANISTATLSSGPGGTLTVNVADVLDISGTGLSNPLGIALVEVPSSLVSSSGREDFPGVVATGQAGELQVSADELIIRDGGAIAIDSLGPGDAGTLQATANLIRLENGGTINAATAAGSGGNIELQTPILLLRQGSNINTNAGNADGGNIAIDTTFLIALENSDITANAVRGRGGRVSITAQSILGTEFREVLTAESDITATSALGPEFNGVVELNTPELEPDSGLVELPTALNEPTDQIVAGCPADSNNRFVIGGQNGLPSNPTQQLQTSGSWQDWRFLNEVAPATTTNNLPTAEQTTISNAQPIREASYAKVNENGQLILASSAETTNFGSQVLGECAAHRDS